MLKGPPDTRIVHHEAWSTWPCDTTRAEVGQRALLLLGEGEIARAPQDVRDAVALVLGPEKVLRNVGSGDGIARMEIQGSDEAVYCGGAPNCLRGERARLSGLLLSDAVRYIEELARFAPELLSVHARSGNATSSSKPSGTFDLRILPDGSSRLAVGLGAAERVRTFQLGASERGQVLSELEFLVGSGERVVGDPKQWNLARKLVVRLPAGTLTLAEQRELDPLTLDPDELRTFRDALLAWDTVTRSIDCPECDDLREKDRAWTQGR